MGETEELRVPADPQLEADVLAALAREGDCRGLFGVLEPADFYSHPALYEALRVAHNAGELRCEAVETGTGHRWRCLDEVAERLLNRLCAGARTLGSRSAAAEHLQALTAKRRAMQAAADLFNALGTQDDEAAQRALEHLRGTAA